MTEEARSARRWLLFGRRRDRQIPEGQLELAWVEAGAGGGPVARRELGGSGVLGPVDEHAEEAVAQVGLGVEPVEAAGGDEGEEVGGGLLSVVVAANDEEPRLSTDGNAAERALAGVVVELEPAVFDDAAEGVTLADDVSERRAGAGRARLFDEARIARRPS